MAAKKKDLSVLEIEDLIEKLKVRFENNGSRHRDLKWDKAEEKLRANIGKLWTLNEMERTGGEPDIVSFDKRSDEITFFDCSEETPKGRRSLCYDRKAWESRKEHKPLSDALSIAKEIGVAILNEEQYQYLQSLGSFDLKTSSWLETPADVRALGGAIFGDRRFDRVFIYHNGAESYYAARGFRGSIKL